jgi:hypothetical protein
MPTPPANYRPEWSRSRSYITGQRGSTSQYVHVCACGCGTELDRGHIVCRRIWALMPASMRHAYTATSAAAAKLRAATRQNIYHFARNNPHHP